MYVTRGTIIEGTRHPEDNRALRRRWPTRATRSPTSSTQGLRSQVCIAMKNQINRFKRWAGALISNGIRVQLS